MLKNNKILILTIGVFISLTNFASAYNIKDYYPLEQGNSWTYIDEGKYEETDKIEGKEIVEDTETIKIKRVDSENKYVCVMPDLEEIKIYKDLEGDEYDIFKPPKAIFSNLAVGETKSYSINVITYNLKGEKIDEQSEDREIKLKSLEDIEVPAGKFSNCLKFFISTQKKGLDGNYDIEDCTVWLAPGVGKVKEFCFSIEYDEETKRREDDVETSELISAVINGKKIGGQ